LLLVLCLAIAAPVAHETHEVQRQPYVHILVDNSSSMSIMDMTEVSAMVKQLRGAVEVRQDAIGGGTDSRIYTHLLRYLSADETIILVTDGNSYDGADMEQVAQYALSRNVSVAVIPLKASRQDYAVRIVAPDVAMDGADTEIRVVIDQAQPGALPRLTLKDGDDILYDQVPSSSVLSLTTRFTTGTKVLSAQLLTSDEVAQNNQAWATLQVVPKPAIALVTKRRDSPLAKLAGQLAAVTIQDYVPQELDNYYAIIIDDQSAAMLEPRRTQLADYLKDGNGLLVVGGKGSFDFGDYRGSPIESILPVRTAGAEKTDDRVNIVLALDISASTGGIGAVRGIDVEKALAADVLDQIGTHNQVGIAAFNTKGYVVEQIAKMDNRQALVDKISRLTDNGGTFLSAGIIMGTKMLRNQPGAKNIILLSDGQSNPNDNYQEAARMAWNEGIKIYTVATGKFIREETMQQIADTTNGIYLLANRSNRLKLIFGKDEEQRPLAFYDLAIVDENHFITKDLDMSAVVGGFNQVVPKDIARLLVSTSQADPIVVAWQFGLGRSVVFASDNGLEWAGQSYGQNASRILARMIAYTVADPQRKEQEYLRISDTVEGKPAEVSVKSSQRPMAENVTFRLGRDGIYRGELPLEAQGLHQAFSLPYAVNAQPELARTGYNPKVEQLAVLTHGTILEPDAKQVMEYALSRSKVQETTDTMLILPFALLALIMYMMELLIRRIVQNRIMSKN